MALCSDNDRLLAMNPAGHGDLARLSQMGSQVPPVDYLGKPTDEAWGPVLDVAPGPVPRVV